MKWLSSLAFLRPLLPDRVALRKHLRKMALIFPLLAAVPFLQANLRDRANLEDRILAAHNRERAALGVPPLIWNAKLAGDAGLWAEHLTRIGYLVHSIDDPRDPDPEGENLWAGTKHHYPPEAMVGLWTAEKRNFVPGLFPANSRTGDLENVGHYTQMMWRSTRLVGCAVATGARDDFLVCRYSEGGNVLGERPF